MSVPRSEGGPPNPQPPTPTLAAAAAAAAADATFTHISASSKMIQDLSRIEIGRKHSGLIDLT